ncbi:membrane protein YdfJ [Paenibacillus favisporus]|uniref:Membrane protein YdfJ n=1 Tax=Paenibacillus favisporus TaxID=221028 RepID=A0ABV2F1K2_9BACL
MAKYLYRLGMWSAKHSKKVIIGGVAILLAVVVLVLAIGPAFNENTPIPGLKSQSALELLNKEFPSPKEEGGQIQMVLKAPVQKTLSSSSVQQFLEINLKKIKEDPQVKSVVSPYDNHSLNANKTIGYSTITYNVPGDQVSSESKEKVEKIAENMREAGWQAELTGAGYVKMEIGGVTEAIGVLAAFIILSFTFASFLTGVLPIVTAAVGLGIGLMGVLLGSNLLDMSSTSLSLSAMLGLAVGIDYALFIVSRYRHQLSMGYDIRESIAIANGTAGSSVVFAGITVMIGLIGLSVAKIPFLTAMGLAGALCVLVAVLTAIVLVPALLAVLGEKISPSSPNRFFQKIYRRSMSKNKKNRLEAIVSRRPWVIVMIGLILLGALALPFSRMELGMPDDAQKSTDKTERRAYDLLSEGYGPGYHSPLIILAKTDGSEQSKKNVTAAMDQLKKLPEIGTMTPAIPSPSGKVFMINVIPATGAHDVKTRILVEHIRDIAPDIQKQRNVELLVTGSTAVSIDISQKLNDALPKFCMVIVGLAFLLLMIVFRSLLVPIKAVLGFVLSLAATLGFAVLVIQDGHLGGLFGFHGPSPILNFLPIIVVGILFGLAMDYEVFLVSRMREEFKHTGDARASVLAGLRHSGGVVTAAGLIMIAVFTGFMMAEDPIIKSMGFALAFGILFDAFVVRLMIVPAVMILMGKSAWYLPKWLDRILPNLDVEGERMMHEVEANKKEATGENLKLSPEQ